MSDPINCYASRQTLPLLFECLVFDESKHMLDYYHCIRLSTLFDVDMVCCMTVSDSGSESLCREFEKHL